MYVLCENKSVPDITNDTNYKDVNKTGDDIENDNNFDWVNSISSYMGRLNNQKDECPEVNLLRHQLTSNVLRSTLEKLKRYLDKKKNLPDDDMDGVIIPEVDKKYNTKEILDILGDTASMGILFMDIKDLVQKVNGLIETIYTPKKTMTKEDMIKLKDNIHRILESIYEFSIAKGRDSSLYLKNLINVLKHENGKSFLELYEEFYFRFNEILDRPEVIDEETGLLNLVKYVDLEKEINNFINITSTFLYTIMNLQETTQLNIMRNGINYKENVINYPLNDIDKKDIAEIHGAIKNFYYVILFLSLSSEKVINDIKEDLTTAHRFRKEEVALYDIKKIINLKVKLIKIFAYMNHEHLFQDKVKEENYETTVAHFIYDLSMIIENAIDKVLSEMKEEKDNKKIEWGEHLSKIWKRLWEDNFGLDISDINEQKKLNLIEKKIAQTTGEKEEIETEIEKEKKKEKKKDEEKK
jgi:hypothetical protein